MSVADWLQHAGAVLIIGSFALLAGYIAGRFRGDNALMRACGTPGDLAFVTGSGLSSAGAFLRGDWIGGVTFAACAAIIAWNWWRRHRKNRRRALARGGYKARALLAKLLERARDAAQPRPIRHPVPQGAAA